ncbi:uncharacterized protein LOC127048847 isoform X1 [Gopherus flavomarginatus]|uniref:uncharacterized protein LOC127048847 isoform X1 n=1 Tax=Gopherus flavomarginatus TaxID=286002 RepID=UPI0021CC4622|nr:uncharacterized protein LOC127048847 isoform X1 [Gopherus flavomarginatus]
MPGRGRSRRAAESGAGRAGPAAFAFGSQEMAESGDGARCTPAGGREGAAESPGGGASSEPGQRAGAKLGRGRAGRRGPELAQGRSADPSPAEWRGPALLAWLLSLIAKGPEVSSGRDRPAGEPDTPRPQLNANSAQSAAGTAHELRNTAERLQTQLEALKGSSDPETLEFLQALEAPVRIASRVLTENQRLRRELEELKGRLAAPPPLEPASQPPAHWASSPWTSQTSPPWATRSTALPLQVRVSGKTAGCERQFLDQVAQLLMAQGISLQAGAYEPHSSHLLLLFCPISSRSGTDISNALEGIPAARKMILVVLHHQPNEQAELYASSKREAQHPGLLHTVDSCFSTRSGFYPCQANAAAVASVSAALQQLALAGH